MKDNFGNRAFLFFALIVLCCFHKAQSQPTMDNNIFIAGATPKLISRQFSFTEGPAADKKGNVYFTDQPNNIIWRYNLDGNLEKFLEGAGRSNGLYFDKKGNLIACADEHNQIWQISKKKKIKVLLKDYNGKKLNGPNDVWAHPSGDLYFTDPYYQRPYWERKEPELKEQLVYRLAKGKKEATPVVKGLNQPNGIIGTPDGQWLYIADIGAGKTYRYSVNRDGSLSNGELFVAMGSDGMTIDEKGNVYLTGNGVTIFNTQGKQIAHIPISEKWTANVTFGGKDHKQLFITASEAIYILDMNVRGAK